MRLYLDHCCFNRPFDDQCQSRVRLETEAILAILDSIQEERNELVWSYILDYENSFNPFEDRKRTITAWSALAITDVDESPQLLEIAERNAVIGTKAKDSLHIACAIISTCDCFITTDDLILKKANRITGVAIMSPIVFFKEMQQ